MTNHNFGTQMESNRCGSSCTSSFAPHHKNAATRSTHYEDVSEPEAPMLSLGERVLWTREFDRVPGTVRWIGRIPHLCYGWTIGVEFDFPILNGGNGHTNGRRYFSSPDGHALFLPSAELAVQNTFVQSPNILSNHHPCSENDDELCCNRYPAPCRDATYGHLKHNCHCSTSARSDHPCNSHRRGPVYGRISARQSLSHYDNPFKNHCRLSVGPGHHPATQNYRHRRLSGDYIDYDVVSSSSRDRSCRENGQFENIYQNGKLAPIEIPCRHSIFSPRSTIGLINGFKEWVSCWVLGTSKRRKKGSVVLNGRKTVTSLIVSQSSQSMSKTGQRLSSFNNYSSVDYCTLRKNNQKQSKLSPQDSSELVVKTSAGKQSQQENSSRKGAVVVYRRHKKGPAPLPPSHQSVNVKLENLNTNKKKSYAVVSSVSKVTIQSQNSKPRNKQATEDISASTSNANHSSFAPSRKGRKKRRAPLPPTSNEKLSHIKDGSSDNHSRNNHLLNNVASYEVDDDWEIIPDSALLLYNSIKDENFGFIDGIASKNTHCGHESVNENSRNSISVSDDESGAEMPNGITSYQLDQRSLHNDGASISNHLNLFSHNTDTRFKISIEKREMNVVTVEEVPPSSDPEDDDNTPSSLSDNEDAQNDDDDKSAVNANTDNSKSSSSEENAPAADPKPIFAELQLTPPPKAGVKDFVNAFNMLADREKYAELRQKRSAGGENAKVLKIQGQSMETNSKSMKSFPTKWQFQNNASNFLLPIEEEESHNEQSESEIDAPVTKANQIVSEKKTISKSDPIVKTSDPSDHKLSGNDSNSKSGSQKCKAPTKQVDKNITVKMKQETDGRKSPRNRNADRKNSLPIIFDTKTTATNPSDVAVSSLLAGKPFKGFPIPKVNGAKMKSKMGKGAPKLDQPIMVSLYIEDKSSHLGPMPLLVTPSMTLRKLKKQVEKDYNFDKDLQCWILGETFAIHDEATLASYGVIEIGCPILLYVMSMDSKTKSLPLKSSFKSKQPPIYDDVAPSSSNSETEDIENLLDRGIGRSLRRIKQSNVPKIDKLKELPKRQPSKHPRTKQGSAKLKIKSNNESNKARENEISNKKNYYALMKLDDIDLVVNTDEFQCAICFLDIDCGDGVVLQDCLHSFCRECLAAAVQFSETAVIKCPFRNDEYSCESHLQEREIKSLVSPEVFERYLKRSMALAESQALDSFHCKTPDCPGWCLYEDNVNTFLCPVCMKINCVTCAAIHEGRNCRQYQDDVANQCNSSEEAKKTKEYLDNMVKDGEAMKCPKCEVILMKKWGCDWLKCSMCQTEVCWVTKGPRWGPGGRGDTSGGCKCMLNSVRCHPKCNYCH